MKYFTPELWVQFQDVATREKCEAAHAAWNEAVAGYAASLSRIDAHLPDPLRDFVKSMSLHDGILVASLLGTTTLTLLVRSDAPSAGLFKLEYGFASPPVINRSALPEEWRSTR